MALGTIWGSTLLRARRPIKGGRPGAARSSERSSFEISPRLIWTEIGAPALTFANEAEFEGPSTHISERNPRRPTLLTWDRSRPTTRPTSDRSSSSRLPLARASAKKVLGKRPQFFAGCRLCRARTPPPQDANKSLAEIAPKFAKIGANPVEVGPHLADPRPSVQYHSNLVDSGPKLAEICRVPSQTSRNRVKFRRSRTESGRNPSNVVQHWPMPGQSWTSSVKLRPTCRSKSGAKSGRCRAESGRNRSMLLPKRSKSGQVWPSSNRLSEGDIGGNWAYIGRSRANTLMPSSGQIWPTSVEIRPGSARSVQN